MLLLLLLFFVVVVVFVFVFVFHFFQNDKKFCDSLSTSGTVHHMIVIFGTRKMIFHEIFFPFFQSYDFFWFLWEQKGKK